MFWLRNKKIIYLTNAMPCKCNQSCSSTGQFCSVQHIQRVDVKIRQILKEVKGKIRIKYNDILFS